MKKLMLLLAGLFFLSGCSGSVFNTLTGSQSVIDWVDFIKWDGKSYEVIYDGILTDELYIGNVIGTVKFKVADNVTNTNYKTKNGDAAFLEKGTKIFAVKNHPELLAVKDNKEIGGYRLYFTRDAGEYSWHFKDLPLEEVKRIEFYSPYTNEGNTLLSTWESTDDIKHILQLLTTSKEDPGFTPNTTEKDPDSFNIILYTEGPVAYRYNLHFDGETYFWSPWETNILSGDIAQYMTN